MGDANANANANADAPKATFSEGPRKTAPPQGDSRSLKQGGRYPTGMLSTLECFMVSQQLGSTVLRVGTTRQSIKIYSILFHLVG
jgi:hypothetical protein